MSRPVIGEISKVHFRQIVVPPLTTANCVSSSHYLPGTIPPDIGNLVKLTELDFYNTKVEGATKIRVMVITCPGR